VLFGAGAALGAARYAFAGRPSAVTAPTPVDVLAL
jgi:hypothetical protein